VSSARPAEVRFYFDADVLGLAKLVCQERADCTYPGDPGRRIKRRERPPCPVESPAMKDYEWIPLVAAQGWVIITRDRRIQDRPAEIRAVRDHGAKMVNLGSNDAGTTWQQLEVLMTRWREIDALPEQPGPFIYIATRRGAFRKVNLGTSAPPSS
jgi:hypothetical protein